MQENPHYSIHQIDDLLQHSAWLERLARELVFDPSAADDLVQETWLVAMRGDDRWLRNPRAWLGGVVRNLLRDRARHEATQRGTERQLALEQRTGAEGQANLQRDLTGKVLALDEPLRSTLLARYFEGLAPREIARRDRIELGTVKSRLARGLAKLREQLEREHGDRRTWGLSLLPLARPSSKSSLAGAVALAGALTLAGSVALGLSGLLSVGQSNSSDPAAGEPGRALVPMASNLSQEASPSYRLSGTNAGDRSSVLKRNASASDMPPVASVEEAGEDEHRIRFSLTDELDAAPISNARVMQLDSMGPLPGLAPTLDCDIVQPVTWNRGVWEFTLQEARSWCWIGAAGYAWKKVYLPGAERVPLAIELTAAGEVEVLFEYGAGADVYDRARVSILSSRGRLVGTRQLASQSSSVLFGEVPAGDYSVAFTAVDRSGKSMRPPGVTVQVVGQSRASCRLVVRSPEETFHRLTGTITGFQGIEGKRPGDNVGLLAVTRTQSVGRNGRRGEFLMLNINGVLSEDGETVAFGPKQLPDGQYTLLVAHQSRAWDFVLSADTHLELKDPASVMIRVEVIDEQTRMPLDGAFLSWSAYPDGALSRAGMPLIHLHKSEDGAAVFELEAMEGWLELRARREGYVTARVSSEVSGGDRLVIEMHHAPVLVIRTLDSCGERLPVKFDWFTGMSLADSRGELSALDGVTFPRQESTTLIT